MLWQNCSRNGNVEKGLEAISEEEQAIRPKDTNPLLILETGGGTVLARWFNILSISIDSPCYTFTFTRQEHGEKYLMTATLLSQDCIITRTGQDFL